MREDATGESLGPQLIADGEPNNEWGLEELDLYARLQYQQILDSESALSPAYWRLGQALVLAKKAYAWRKRKRATNADESREASRRQTEIRKLRPGVAAISLSSADLAHEAAFADAAEAEILIPAVRTAIEELQRLLQHLEEQASGGA